MTVDVPPGLPLVLGALLAPLVPRLLRPAWLLLVPAAGLAHVVRMSLAFVAPWESWQVEMLGHTLTLVRVDRLSLVFGIIFHIAALLSAIYALHVREASHHVAGLSYAGAAVGAVFAGDLVTLFVWWELTAVASAFLVWQSGTPRALAAGTRNIVIQIISGVLLLAGAAILASRTGSIAFGRIGLDAPGGVLILAAFGIKCAFPLMHNWLQDAYPESTPHGTVYLSAFTTKLAVYALARGFPGTEMLIWVGAAMTALPIFYAVIENDLRRVLAYSLNNQLGFMVVGVGLGTEMALNGTAAHAFCHILYKALLFMSMGAVLHRTGTCNGTDLGGLYKSMPWTAAFCVVGAASISGFPLFSGFVSKSLILTATADNHRTVVWFVLLFASAGVFHHSGIKIPYFAFFGHDSGKRCPEAPPNMLAAMAVAAAACIGLGCWPRPLYAILPYAVEYAPYTAAHVVTQLQLLAFSALAFGVLMRTGLYPPEQRALNLDFDWIYRWLGPRLARWTIVPALAAIGRVQPAVGRDLAAAFLGEPGPDGRVRPPAGWSASTAVLVAVLALFVYLLIDYWRG